MVGIARGEDNYERVTGQLATTPQAKACFVLSPHARTARSETSLVVHGSARGLFSWAVTSVRAAEAKKTGRNGHMRMCRLV